MILPASMITTMPRATPMISATPSRSRAPLTKVSTKFLFVGASNLATRMAEARNRPTSGPSTSHRDHPESMTTKVRPKSASMSLCRSG